MVSLARPGGNVTGLATLAPELIGKRVELLRRTLPSVSRVGVIWNPDPGLSNQAGQVQDAEAAAGPLGLKLVPLEVHERVDALTLVDNLVTSSNVARVGGLALAHRLPMVSTVQFVAAGGLLAYGANRAAQHRRAASYVDRILKGADPAEMPVERPTTFDLVINLKTARTLGLTIPQSVLQQATEIIQ